MSTGWDNQEPAPLEYFHSKLLDAFHELRKKQGDNPGITLTLDGSGFNNIVAKAKVATYAKYPKQVNSQAILKTEL